MRLTSVSKFSRDGFPYANVLLDTIKCLLASERGQQERERLRCHTTTYFSAIVWSCASRVASGEVVIS